ncbi:RHS repeat-associated core domain-containing protein, partial [Chitinispirillales bacterium ANBcel5]|uniref:RHS repeat-associated core domain-containing protein n=1 Tax=Cellulosispirillum alkaliphilum TaxID=3039283 RepID=UPI002A5092F7|nr:RHS repeat-associated core domain-containing protein [Chitinispirillales bacterium ANBcel5]
YYDSDIGRWVSTDPAREFWDLYRYTTNPVVFIDPDGLSELHFFRDLNLLVATHRDGTVAGSWNASNNASSTSNGRWPAGTYNYSYTVNHAGAGRDSRLGDVANFVFEVPGRTGMGVHSGRENSTDGAGRSGWEHATLGCIRVTHETMVFISEILIDFLDDPLTNITVIDNTQEWLDSRTQNTSD